MVTRRTFLEAGGLAGFGLAAGRPLVAASQPLQQDPQPPLNRPSGPAEVVARDEAYWGRVRACYRVSDRFTNLEAGYYGMMAVALYNTPADADRLAQALSKIAGRG